MIPDALSNDGGRKAKSFCEKCNETTTWLIHTNQKALLDRPFWQEYSNELMNILCVYNYIKFKGYIFIFCPTRKAKLARSLKKFSKVFFFFKGVCCVKESSLSFCPVRWTILINYSLATTVNIIKRIREAKANRCDENFSGSVTLIKVWKWCALYTSSEHIKTKQDLYVYVKTIWQWSLSMPPFSGFIKNTQTSPTTREGVELNVGVPFCLNILAYSRCFYVCTSLVLILYKLFY